MNTLNKILDKCREVCSSDAEIARHLGVSRAAVSLWRDGGKITPQHLAKLLALSHQDPALAVQVLAEQQATPEEQRLWGALWDRLSPVTSTVAGALLMVGLWAPSPAWAQAETVSLNDGRPVHYAQWLRRLRTWLATMGRRPRSAHASPVLA